ncbi:MAG: uracil-DNA glycosylase [Ignavibacteriaceae bacterium]|jgi:DNA polymerase|nr:uracil-DNA glycosylase [Ignavibacteriaceae bacterium]
MSESLEKFIIEAIKDQREIFGDFLFDNIDIRIEKKKSSSDLGMNMKNKLSSSTIDESYRESVSIEELYEKIHNCVECPLGETRTKFVFGTGNPNAEAMLIGEAPGADEDKQGEPFVGRAGKLLTDILAAIQLKREDVFIANILKCRPPNNRDPLPEETDTCFPYLEKQIELIQPKIILCLGRVAANGLLNKKLTLGDWRKDEHEYKGIKVIVTYHPAALLRNPNWKRGCWEDVKIFKKYYDELANK